MAATKKIFASIISFRHQNSHKITCEKIYHPNIAWTRQQLRACCLAKQQALPCKTASSPLAAFLARQHTISSKKSKKLLGLSAVTSKQNKDAKTFNLIMYKCGDSFGIPLNASKKSDSKTDNNYRSH